MIIDHECVLADKKTVAATSGTADSDIYDFGATSSRLYRSGAASKPDAEKQALAGPFRLLVDTFDAASNTTKAAMAATSTVTVKVANALSGTALSNAVTVYTWTAPTSNAQTHLHIPSDLLRLESFRYLQVSVANKTGSAVRFSANLVLETPVNSAVSL